MNSFQKSAQFDKWLRALRDQKAKVLILRRLTQAEIGNFGDIEPVGEGITEMRIHYGPGYRVYYTRKGATVYLLLIGGDKSSQKRDIRQAIELARNIGKE